MTFLLFLADDRCRVSRWQSMPISNGVCPLSTQQLLPCCHITTAHVTTQHYPRGLSQSFALKKVLGLVYTAPSFYL